MIGSVIGLIIACIFLGFLWWAGQQLMALISIAEPFRTFVNILIAFLILVIVIWVFIQMLAIAGIQVPIFEGRGLR